MFQDDVPSFVDFMMNIKRRIDHSILISKNEAPILMNGYTIFMKDGYIQTGYQPRIQDDECFFSVRCCIVMGNTWIMLDRSELENFFIELRKKPEVKAESSSNVQLLSVRSEYTGKFTIDCDENRYRVMFTSNIAALRYTLVMNKESVTKIMTMEHLLINKMLGLDISHGSASIELKDLLDDAYTKCSKYDADYIKSYARYNTSDDFITGLATHSFEFFKKYYEIKNKQ